MQSEIDSIKSEYQQPSETGRSQDSRGAGSLYEVESPTSKDHGYDQNGMTGYYGSQHQPRHGSKDPDNESHDPEEGEINGQHLGMQPIQIEHHGTVQMNGHTFQHINPLDHHSTSQKEFRSGEQEDSDNYLPEIPEGGANTEQGSPTAGSSNLTHTVWVSHHLSTARNQKLLHRGQEDVQQENNQRNTKGTAERPDTWRRRLAEADPAAV